MGRFRKSSYTHNEFFQEKHRFEHWHRDNTVYFITARCRGGFAAFASEEAITIFWDRFDHYCARYGFIPWVTSLLHNHYHTLGYLKIGEDLGPLMQHVHGSLAKLVNDTLKERLLPFWRERGNKDYFDGCIRDVLQAMCAYRYTLLQSVRHGIISDYRLCPHTRVRVERDIAIARAVELNALLADVPYARYDRHRKRRSQ